jgi:hypothetical protein
MEKGMKMIFIKGKFSPEDAKSILLTLINTKINYHSLKNYSLEERFQKRDPLSDERIESLTSDRQTLLTLIEDAMAGGLQLQIDSTIKIVAKK